MVITFPVCGLGRSSITLFQANRLKQITRTRATQDMIRQIVILKLTRLVTSMVM